MFYVNGNRLYDKTLTGSCRTFGIRLGGVWHIDYTFNLFYCDKGEVIPEMHSEGDLIEYLKSKGLEVENKVW